MSKKKRKRVKEPESPIGGFIRRHPKLGRRLGITAALAVAALAFWFVADPFGGGLTAIDESGEEVRVGIIDGEPNAKARTGQPAPNFLLPDYDRQAVRLDQFQGKVVFINFWASWCGPCEREMPFIQQVAEQFPDDVVVLAVNRGESEGIATGWTRSRNFREDLPNFYWLRDERESVFREYQRGSGMPQSFFIDRNGIVRETITRGMEYDEMLVIVQNTINASVSSPPNN